MFFLCPQGFPLGLSASTVSSCVVRLKPTACWPKCSGYVSLNVGSSYLAKLIFVFSSWKHVVSPNSETQNLVCLAC